MTASDGYVVLWRTTEGVFSYVLPGGRSPYVASTPDELSSVAQDPLPDDGFMQPDTRYVVSTEYARREFGLDV